MKLREILKMRHVVNELPESPRFLRDNMHIEDIEGARAKPLYTGIAKDILKIGDIEGTKPKFEKVRKDYTNNKIIFRSNQRTTIYLTIQMLLQQEDRGRPLQRRASLMLHPIPQLISIQAEDPCSKTPMPLS